MGNEELNGKISELNHKRDYLAEAKESKEFKDLKQLIGLKVTEILPIFDGCSLWFEVVFDNGVKLIGRDGEYGDSVIEIIKPII